MCRSDCSSVSKPFVLEMAFITFSTELLPYAQVKRCQNYEKENVGS